MQTTIPTTRPSHHILACSIASLLALTSSGMAAAWVGNISGDFNDASNWDSNPAGQNVYIGILGNNGGPAPFRATLSSNLAFGIVDLQVARGGGPAIFNHTAGTAATGGGNWTDIGTDNGTGTYNMANTAGTGGTLTGFGQGSGSLSTTRIYVGATGYNGNGGSGAMNIHTSGTVSVGNDIFVGKSSGAPGSGTGVLRMDSGTINQGGGWTVVGVDSGGNGALNMSGGAVNFNHGNQMILGLNGGTGSMNMTGGTFTMDGEFWVGQAGGSIGTLAVSGGSVNVGNWMALGRSGGSGVLTISGTGLVRKTDNDGALEITNGGSPTASGILNLDGGTLQMNQITGSGGGGSTANFFFNGGTLKPTVNNGDFINGNPVLIVKNGGAVVDTDSFDITINKAFTPGVASTGGLTKNGAGTLALGPVSTYAGNTVVNGGTLQLNNGSQTGNLAGDGQIIINNGGTVSSGAVDGTGYYNHTANNGITINVGGTLRTLENGRLSMDRTINSVGGTIASTGVNFDNAASYNFRFEGEAGETNSYNFTSSLGGVASTISATHIGVDNAIFNVTDGPGAVDLNVTGNIVDKFGVGGLTKAGNGVMVIANASNPLLTGPTTVTGGTLRVNGNISSSAVTVNGGTLGGNGTVGGTTVNAGGSLAPGASIGTLSFAASLTLAGTANFEIDKTGFTLTADLADVLAGTLTFGGTLIVTATGSTLADGDIFDLFNAPTFAGSFSTLNLPSLDPGLTWETSNLGTNGTIAVVPEPTTFGLLALAGLGLASRRRRK